MKSDNKGFIRNIILIVGALVALKYFFHFDVVDLIAEGKFGEVWVWIKVNVWQKFILDILWSHTIDFFKKLFN